MAKYSKLHVTKIGLAVGLTWAIGVFFLGILGMFGVDGEIIRLIGTVYIGYSATITGTIIGTIWAFVDGFIGGVIFAWIYNKLLK
jgi:hypothetical protein